MAREKKENLGEKKQINVIVGGNIRKERIHRNLSIDSLAEMLGLSTAFIGLIERGERGTTLTNLLSICELFGVSLNTLIKDAEKEAVVAEVKETEVENLRETISTLLYRMDPIDLQYVVDMLKNYRTCQYKKTRAAGNSSVNDEFEDDDK